MTHQYKRRTMDDAIEMARIAFVKDVDDHLSGEEMEEFRLCSTITSGTPSDEWETVLGFTPEMKSYYEIHLYKPSDECPYIEKSYAKILVPRNRDTNKCEMIWKPEVPPYDGPWFS